jgi:small nuclear ribonucleoprotein (snRNP)-like protein
MPSVSQRFKELVSQQVVVDTDTQHLYIGKLKSVDDEVLELTEVDIHDSQSTTTPRDLYIINTAKYGIKKNRERVLVRMARVVSLSALSEVTQY